MTLKLSFIEAAMLEAVMLTRAKEQIKTYAYYKSENRPELAGVFRDAAMEKFRVYKRLKEGLKV